MSKYAILRERVCRGLVPPHELAVPDEASDTDLLRVHLPSWVAAVTHGRLSPAEIRRIGFPWSPAMVERSRRSVGATIAASRAALRDGVAVNLAGGTHHAFPDHGEGFCVFNDIAVAARTMQAEGMADRIAVIDTDVHQGDGTALVFRDDPTVFTFSVHGQSNFPFRKQQSDLDIGLPDAAGDEEFINAIRRGLDAAFSNGRPGLVYYLAGADAFERDLLGRLSVTISGLVERDRLVFECCAKEGVPVVVVMGGGYGARIDETVAIHYATVETAARFAVARAGAAEPTSL
jgi:acetoin utilization deacetylase AcuC-like enzyme